MKLYVAASFTEKEKVKNILKQCRECNHEITLDWTEHSGVAIGQRDKKIQEVQQYAVDDVKGVQDCDIFILLVDPLEGKGKYVELGIALHSAVTSAKPIIYVVGEATNSCIFYYHQLVKRRRTIEEVLEKVSESQ